MTFVFKPYMPFAGAWVGDPGGWKTPALTDVPTLPSAVSVFAPPPQAEMHPDGGISAGRRKFFSVAPGSSDNVSGAAIVGDYFSKFHSQLESAVTPDAALAAWSGLTTTLGWMPATDLESADRRVSEFTKLLERKLRDFQLRGWGLTAHDVFRAVLRYEGFKRSLGKLLEESARDKKWGKMVANRFKSLSDFCRRSPDADWEDADVEFFHLLRREEENAMAAAGVEAFRQRALRQLAAVDPENLEAVTEAAKILQLFPDEQWEELGDHLARIRLRLEAGEERWDPHWMAPDFSTPAFEDEFVSLELGGQTFSLHFGASLAEALLNSPFREPAEKRLNDIRTTPEIREGVAWIILVQLQSLAERSEKALSLFREWQKEMVAEFRSFPIFVDSLEKWKKILEAGVYRRTRCGAQFVRVDPEAYAIAQKAGGFNVVWNGTGLRLLGPKEIRKMKKMEIGPKERTYLEGLVKLAPLGNNIHSLLWFLDGESQAVETPFWEKAYRDVVSGAGAGKLEPHEAALRLVRLVKKEELLNPETLRVDFFLRGEVEGEKRIALENRLEGVGFSFVRKVVLGEKHWNAGSWRLLLEKMIRSFIFGPSPLRLLAGDLLETGRKESPWDDRYTLEELGRLLSAWEQTVETIRKEQHPVAVFKREAGKREAPFEQISPAWAALLCDSKLGTKLDVPAFIRKQWPDVDLRPENFRKIGEGRAQTIFAIAAWREVLMYALKTFSDFKRGEPYDEEFLDMLVAIVNGGEKEVLDVRDGIREGGEMHALASRWKKGVQQRMGGLVDAERIGDFRFPVELLMEQEVWTPEEMRFLVRYFTLQSFLLGSRFGTRIPKWDERDIGSVKGFFS